MKNFDGMSCWYFMVTQCFIAHIFAQNIHSELFKPVVAPTETPDFIVKPSELKQNSNSLPNNNYHSAPLQLSPGNFFDISRNADFGEASTTLFNTTQTSKLYENRPSKPFIYEFQQNSNPLQEGGPSRIPWFAKNPRSDFESTSKTLRVSTMRQQFPQNPSHTMSFNINPEIPNWFPSTSSSQSYGRFQQYDSVNGPESHGYYQEYDSRRGHPVSFYWRK